jgi:hypothetical protein
MERPPAIAPEPDLSPAQAGPNDSFDSAVDDDAGTGARLHANATGVTGASVDTLYDFGLPPEALGDDMEDADLDEPVPNAERLVAQAVALANTAMFAPYQVATWNDIGADFKEPTGLWVNDYGGYMAIGYDSGKAPAPTSVPDLLKAD